MSDKLKRMQLIDPNNERHPFPFAVPPLALVFALSLALVSCGNSAERPVAPAAMGKLGSDTETDAAAETSTGSETGEVFASSETPSPAGAPEPAGAGVSVSHGTNLVYPTRTVLYRSTDGGRTWTASRPLEQFNSSLYMTAAAVDPGDAEHIVVASSYQGLYETRSGGAAWNRLNGGRLDDVLYQGSNFYDEVNALWIPAGDPDVLLFRVGFTADWYRYRWSDGSLEPAPPGELTDRYPDIPPVLFTDLSLPPDGTDPRWSRVLPLYESGWPLPPQTAGQTAGQSAGQSAGQAAGSERLVPDEAWFTRRSAASDRTGIYLNPYQASANLDDHLRFVIDHGMNSVVVDFKDDFGYLTYDSSLRIVDRVRSENVRFDARQLVAKAHELGIYVIARLVVFKDRQLARFENGRYALWDVATDRPWGVFRQETPEPTEANPEPQPVWVQTEYWVDPYSDFVHQYNIAVAQELQDLGVDEIQFDYIRFPSDGNTRNIRSRYWETRNTEAHPAGFDETLAGNDAVIHAELLADGEWPGPGTPAQDSIADRVAALQTFLRRARAIIDTPIGTDVFGFNAWARMGYLGQDIEAFSFYVDVISPMAYPSHYARDFLPELSYFERARTIYDEGTYRARSITGDRVLIRPYVQAFLIGSELRYEKPEYTEYLNLQIRGTMQGGGSGFTMWNNSGRYYMVDTESFMEARGIAAADSTEENDD